MTTTHHHKPTVKRSNLLWLKETFDIIPDSVQLITRRPRGTSIYSAYSTKIAARVYIKHEQRTGSYTQERTALVRLNTFASNYTFYPKLYGYSDERQLIVMEKAPGVHLENYYYTSVQSDSMRTEIAVKLLAAFRELHRHGIAHFDTHEENMFYDEATGRFTLIDYGSCGVGDNIAAVHLSKLRSPLCESKKRFYRAPELTKTIQLHGDLAERYGISSQIYALVWGLRPLDAAHIESSDRIDIDLLQSLTRDLRHYDPQRHEPLLQALLTNFNPDDPNARIHTIDNLEHLVRKVCYS